MKSASLSPPPPHTASLLCGVCQVSKQVCPFTSATNGQRVVLQVSDLAPPNPVSYSALFKNSVSKLHHLLQYADSARIFISAHAFADRRAISPSLHAGSIRPHWSETMALSVLGYSWPGRSASPPTEEAESVVTGFMHRNPINSNAILCKPGRSSGTQMDGRE